MWESNDIDRLIATRTPESPTLEFKAQLPGKADKDRAEFLKDVTALANASGGSILYGISESKGEAVAKSGLQIDNADGEITRLAQVLEAGVEPRLAAIKFEVVPSDEGDVLALDVPASFDGPHRYHFNGHTRFVQRGNTHVSELSFEQLRSAFSRTSSRVETLRMQWRKQLTLDNLWRPMMSGPVCVVRLCSIAAADGQQLIDPQMAHGHWEKLIFSDWMGGNRAYNYEGLVAYPGGPDSELAGLVQVNRYGAISAYRTGGGEWKGEQVIPAVRIGDFIVSASNSLRNFALTMGLRGSALLNVALVRVGGHSLVTDGAYGFHELSKATTSTILFPEVWLQDLTDDQKLDGLLQPGFDLLWQSFGRSHCPHFNSDGVWMPQSR